VSAEAPGLPPRWRLPLLLLGFLSLAFGIAGGLARLAPAVPAPAGALVLHGAVMVSGFFGTVIALERAVALGRLWAYSAPLAAGVGGALLLADVQVPGFLFMIAAAAAFCAASIVIVARQPSVETATLLAGAAAWLAGAVCLLLGVDPVRWWIAFFALTIGAERLELSRYLKRSRFSRLSFIALAAGVLLCALEPSSKAQGAILVLLALWLFAFDLARITIRQTRLPRYIAACLLAGYFWLAVSGVLLALGAPRDGALHAFFLGFVVSMVFGHAPVILPAVLRVPFPYHPVVYVPLVVLHASLAARVAVSVPAGAWGNAAAVALFNVTAAFLVLKRRAS
jgi:hypothetical protein